MNYKAITLATLLGAASPLLDGLDLTAQEPPTMETQVGKHEHTREWYQQFKDYESLKKEVEQHPTAWGYVRLGDIVFEPWRNEANTPKEILESVDQLTRRALDLDSKNPEARCNLSTCYLIKGDLKEAEAQARMGLDVSTIPQSTAGLYVNLSIISSIKHDWDSVRKYIRLGLSEDASNRDLLEFKRRMKM